MTLLASDTFDRTDVSPIGAPWTTVTSNGAMKIVSNAATPVSLASDSAAWIAGTFSADQWVQARLFSTHVGTGAGVGSALLVRTASGANTCYRLCADHSTTTNLNLGKFVAGTFTSLWVRLKAFTNGDLFRMEVIGTTIRVYVNGVQVGADTTDASIASGNPGIGYSSADTGNSIDNFQAGNFGGSNLVQQAAIYRAHNW